MTAHPTELAGMRAAFDALPETHRLVLQLARGGRRYADIAEHLGVSVALVRTWALHGVLALTSARTAPAAVPGAH